MNKIKINAWVSAARLRTLPLAMSGILLASFIAASEGSFHWDVFVLALTTTLLLQILSNLANDYGDFTHGTDNENRVGPERAVQSGMISPTEMKRAIYIVGLLALHSGMFLLTAALDGIFDYIFILFLISGLVAIGAAIKYTVGKKNYGYKGYGDVMVFIFFGIVAIMGTYFLHVLHLNYLVLLPASAIGLLCAGVLNVNNMRDLENDKASGKNTLAVKFGLNGSKIYHLLLISSGIFLMTIYIVKLGKVNLLFSLALPILPLVFHCLKVVLNTEHKKFDKELKRLSLSTFLLSLWVGIGLML